MLSIWSWSDASNPTGGLSIDWSGSSTVSSLKQRLEFYCSLK